MPISGLQNKVEVADGRAERRRDNAEKLFDAAMRLAKQSGYQSLKTEDICHEAGVGRATFFRIFKSKAGLLREFNRRLAIEIADSLDQRQVENKQVDAAEKLSIVADGIALAWLQGGVVLAAMVTDYISNPEQGSLHWVHQEIYNIVVDIVAQGITDGELRDLLEAEKLASLILHQINIAIVEAAMDGQQNFQPLVQEVLGYLLNGAFQK